MGHKEFYVSAKQIPLPEYKPLHDPGLKHYWCYPSVKSHLELVGFIADDGSLIDVRKYRSREKVVQNQLASVARRAALNEESKRFREYALRVLSLRAEADRRREDEIRALKSDLQLRRELLGSEGGNPLSSYKMPAYRSVLNEVNRRMRL